MSVVFTIVMITLVLSIYGLANYYIGKNIYQLLNYFFPINIKIYVGFLILLSLIFLLGFMRSFLPVSILIRNVLGWISSYWMGIFVYLLLFFLLADFIILIAKLINIVTIPENIHLYKGLIVVILTIGIVSYGVYNANQIKKAFYEVKLKEERLNAPLKLILISDLHLGAVNSEKNLDVIVDEINNLKADIVCIAGDTFNDDINAIKDSEKVISLLKNIKAKYGVYASLGNHDGGKTFSKMIEFLNKSNIKLLNDDYEVIDNRFIIFGRVDGTPIGGFDKITRKTPEEIKTIVDTLNPNIPLIVMDHNPTNISQYGSEVDLIVGGHSHKGQIFPANLITDAIYTVDYGYYQKDKESAHVVITSGVGTWGMPMRIASNNEIVLITLS